MSDFFDYNCDACGAPFCERVHVMNLSLGLVEIECCIACLSSQYQKLPLQMAEFCLNYVQARDCFHDPWKKFSTDNCPNRETNTCYCRQVDEDAEANDNAR